MDYAKIIRERRPKLRANSVAAYALSLKSMAPPDSKDLDYLYDTKEILQRLEKYKPNTRKNHLMLPLLYFRGLTLKGRRMSSRSTRRSAINIRRITLIKQNRTRRLRRRKQTGLSGMTMLSWWIECPKR